MSELSDQLQRFTQQARDPTWLEEPVGISMDISRGLFRYRKFRGVSHRFNGGTIVFDAEWVGSGDSLSEVARDFFASYGEFAESSQYIRRVIEPDSIVFDVMSGDIDRLVHGGGDWQSQWHPVLGHHPIVTNWASS